MDIDQLRETPYWTDREGRAAVALWRRSGEPLASWARSVGLARTRLAYWVQRIGARPVGSSIALAPVAVMSAAPRSSLTVELRSGRAVRIDGDVDDLVLARVIAVAERV
jgi:hypothetical protein